MAARPDHLRSIVDHDGAVILDIKRDQFFSLNPMGAYIWARLVEGQRCDEIAETLARETGTDIAVVMSDVNDFLADLKSKHLFDFAAQRSPRCERPIAK